MSNINKILYGEKVNLKIKIDNPDGGNAEILIEKEDKTELTPGTSEIKITSSVRDGNINESLLIQEKWEDTKPKNKNDKLVATVKYDGKARKSGTLELFPKPQIILNFRRKDAYNGEYGFDWFRDKEDRVSYEDIVGTFDKREGDRTRVFTKSDAKIQIIKRTIYDETKFHWYDIKYDWYYKDNGDKERKYLNSILALYPNDEVTLSVRMEVFEESLKSKVKEIELEFDDEYFEVTPDKISIKSKGKHYIKDNIKIKCIKEFNSNKLIKAKALDRIVGQIQVLKNNKSNRYQANVVFVKVKTRINGAGSDNTGGTTGEEAFLKKYLKQALVKLELKEEVMDLTSDANFNSDYITTDSARRKVINNYPSGKPKIHNYLEPLFNTNNNAYRDYYKVFFFDERGGYWKSSPRRRYVGLNGGAAGIVAKSVVLYNTHNTSTTTHELLHAMGLYHTFSNRSRFTFDKNKTENIMDYSHNVGVDRISTYQWQWDIIHGNVKKEP